MLLSRPSHNGHPKLTKTKLFHDDCPACNMNASFGEWHCKEYATSEERKRMQDLAKRVYLYGPWNNDGTLNMNLQTK